MLVIAHDNLADLRSYSLPDPKDFSRLTEHHLIAGTTALEALRPWVRPLCLRLLTSVRKPGIDRMPVEYDFHELSQADMPENMNVEHDGQATQTTAPELSAEEVRRWMAAALDAPAPQGARRFVAQLTIEAAWYRIDHEDELEWDEVTPQLVPTLTSGQSTWIAAPSRGAIGEPILIELDSGFDADERPALSLAIGGAWFPWTQGPAWLDEVERGLVAAGFARR